MEDKETPTSPFQITEEGDLEIKYKEKQILLEFATPMHAALLALAALQSAFIVNNHLIDKEQKNAGAEETEPHSNNGN